MNWDNKFIPKENLFQGERLEWIKWSLRTPAAAAALNECMNRTCDNFHSLHDHQQTDSMATRCEHPTVKIPFTKTQMSWCSLCHFYRFFDFELVHKINKQDCHERREIWSCVCGGGPDQEENLFQDFCRLKSEIRGTHRGSLTFISIKNSATDWKLVVRCVSLRIIQNRCDFYFDTEAESPSETAKNSL